MQTWRFRRSSPCPEQAVKAALTSDEPLRLQGIEVPVPRLANEKADDCAAEIADALQ